MGQYNGKMAEHQLGASFVPIIISGKSQSGLLVVRSKNQMSARPFKQKWPGFLWNGCLLPKYELSEMQDGRE